MKHFTWDDFIGGSISVKCRSLEEAREFCNIAHEKGFRWASGSDLRTETYYRGSTVYYLYSADRGGILYGTKFEDDVDYFCLGEVKNSLYVVELL